ncbi:unnamed protein product [Parnassius apollo]|uniref:(apollo) hypothetical protein n=1 Tax=Parnassius apollo TaxID=110799 RepID=A0A8S3XES1_PARAO|nr:unnamed protein product [Parnassius apollo]
MYGNLDNIGSLEKSSLPLLESSMLEQILADDDEQHSVLPITTSAGIHYNPNVNPAELTDFPRSRSITPIPPEFISLETESQFPEPISEADVVHSISSRITSPSILVTDTSATSPVSGASS